LLTVCTQFDVKKIPQAGAQMTSDVAFEREWDPSTGTTNIGVIVNRAVVTHTRGALEISVPELKKRTD
jgi:hypothetical protein